MWVAPTFPHGPGTPRPAYCSQSRASPCGAHARRQEEHTMAPNGYANPNVLVETDYVALHLSDPTLRLVEVDVDTTAYDSGHISGAVGWNWKTDLQRHPVRDIPTPEEWEALLGRSGV